MVNPPFENREGWGSLKLIRFRKSLGQPALTSAAEHNFKRESSAPRFCSQQKSLPCGRLSEEKAGRTVPAFGKSSGSDNNVRATQNAYCAGAAGALEPEASCSRSFFIRLTSTRPPLMRFGFAPASALAASGAGALPMPTT